MIKKKKCRRCSKLLPLSGYYKHPQMGDGHLNICKVCKIKDGRKRRKLFPDRVRAYEKSRALLPHRIKAREEYAKTKRGKERSAAAKNAWAKRNRKKRAAHVRVHDALKRGLLVRMPCAVCGSEKVQAHHENYNRPLDVDWLCVRHHRERHKFLESARNL